MTALHRISWVFSNLVTTIALLITVIYWAALYSPEEGVDYFNLFVHGLNSVIVVVDIFVSARPWRMHHVYIPIIYGLW
jgi:hypothetical protein